MLRQNGKSAIPIVLEKREAVSFGLCLHSHIAGRAFEE
jgi:hypothetical protein